MSACDRQLLDANDLNRPDFQRLGINPHMRLAHSPRLPRAFAQKIVNWFLGGASAVAATWSVLAPKH